MANEKKTGTTAETISITPPNIKFGVAGKARRRQGVARRGRLGAAWPGKARSGMACKLTSE